MRASQERRGGQTVEACKRYTTTKSSGTHLRSPKCCPPPSLLLTRAVRLCCKGVGRPRPRRRGADEPLPPAPPLYLALFAPSSAADPAPPARPPRVRRRRSQRRQVHRHQQHPRGGARARGAPGREHAGALHYAPSPSIPANDRSGLLRGPPLRAARQQKARIAAPGPSAAASSIAPVRRR